MSSRNRFRKTQIAAGLAAVRPPATWPQSPLRRAAERADGDLTADPGVAYLLVRSARKRRA